LTTANAEFVLVMYDRISSSVFLDTLGFSGFGALEMLMSGTAMIATDPGDNEL
jgi:hypothetical protein